MRITKIIAEEKVFISYLVFGDSLVSLFVIKSTDRQYKVFIVVANFV